MSNKQFVIGLHAVESLLRSQPERIIRLYAYEERHDKKIQFLINLANKLNVPVELNTKQALDRMTQHLNHQGMVALCAKMKTYSETDLKLLIENAATPAFFLILDGVQDPHNLGACFRSADAAGVHAIIAPKDKAASITPIVSKVASGAAEVIPFVQVTNLVRTIEKLKEFGVWVYGAAGDAHQSLYQANLSGPLAMVLGAEGEGLRRLTKEHCDGLLSIPMSGTVSSLNVSVAAGIFLFEVVRQRGL